MYMFLKNGVISCFCFWCGNVNAQMEKSTSDTAKSLKQDEISYYKSQTDLIDLGMKILHRNPNQRLNDVTALQSKLKLSVGPILEYTLATGFAGGVSAAGAFSFSDTIPTKVSSFLFAAKYTQKKLPSGFQETTSILLVIGAS